LFSSNESLRETGKGFAYWWAELKSIGDSGISCSLSTVDWVLAHQRPL
jgi:hypothetical protein